MLNSILPFTKPADLTSMNYSAVPSAACTTSAIPYPTVFGAEILNLSAQLVQNYTSEVSDELYYNHPSVSVKGVDYCNVTVTYTHPGQNDTINVETWLPLDTWNGRLQAVGGGGWVAGRFPLSTIAMSGALGEGYAATTSDAGIGSSYTPDPWALNSPGNVNMYALENLASVSLNDQAIIAKDVIKSFYGHSASYSYWSGCSQGGRQGLMLAQRYPEAYDGIAASAPAINWAEFFPASAWAQVMMEITSQHPAKCEMDALTDAAVKACDPLDGITDGLISDYKNCSFDPFALVGTVHNCSSTGQTVTISNASATIANLTWTGPRKANGDFLWYGVEYQARLSGSSAPAGTTADLGYASTICSSNGTCVGWPTGLGETWFQLFIKANPKWDYTNIESVDEYTRLFQASVQQFDSIIGTAYPDLSQFRDAGGKLIAYHGMADGLIPTRGTSDYYDRVTEVTSDVHDYFRYFEVPGLAHCAGGSGGQPTSTFQALVDWVEHGVVPETLPIYFNDTAGVLNERILCPYPRRARLVDGAMDVTKAASFECKL